MPICSWDADVRPTYHAIGFTAGAMALRLRAPVSGVALLLEDPWVGHQRRQVAVPQLRHHGPRHACKTRAGGEWLVKPTLLPSIGQSWSSFSPLRGTHPLPGVRPRLGALGLPPWTWCASNQVGP